MRCSSACWLNFVTWTALGSGIARPRLDATRNCIPVRILVNSFNLLDGFLEDQPTLRERECVCASVSSVIFFSTSPYLP